MKRIIIYIGAILLLLNSCQDFLHVEPDEQVSIKEQFSTLNGVEQAVNGVYYKFENLLTSKYYLYADLMGGNLTFPPTENDSLIEVPAGRDIENVYEFSDQENASEYASFYGGAYEIINAVNTVLSEISDNDVLSTEQYEQVRAEMLACRAYTHYMLSAMYAQNYSYTPDASHMGIVYNARLLKAGIDFPARESVAETYRLLKTDFEEALSLFNSKHFLPYGEDDFYFNDLTTVALFARVALQMNDWETAYLLSDSVIESSGLRLTPDSLYRSEWEDTLCISETIFELAAPRSSEGQVSASVAKEYYSIDSLSYNDFVASGDLLDLYLEGDIRQDMFIDTVMQFYENGILTPGYFYFTRKFQTAKNIPLVRLSEMYLIRSESAARKTVPDEASALNDLNEIRMRAGMVALTDATDILEEIFAERRRELAFENFLLYDIARYHKDIERDKGCIAIVKGQTYPSDYYVLPLPASTVLMNENMRQNDGY